jgi:hypothetical protein
MISFTNASTLRFYICSSDICSAVPDGFAKVKARLYFLAQDMGCEFDLAKSQALKIYDCCLVRD